MIGTAAILIVRLVWAGTLIYFVDNRVAIAPLERGFSLIAIAFLTWCIAPAWDEVASIRATGLVIITIGSLAGMYYAYFDWLSRINVVAYADTAQAPAWAGAGLILTLGCVITLSVMRPFDWTLRLATVLPIFVALILQFFAVSPSVLSTFELSPQISTGVIPVWDRFAWLLSTPLLVAIAYRRVMSYLLNQTGLTGKGRTRLATMLEQSVNLLESDEMLGRIENAAELFDGMYGVQFVGLASFSNEDEQYADLAIVQKDPAGFEFEEPRRWMLNLIDWPFVLEALEQRTAIQLSPYDKSATRKVYELHQELHLRFVTPILTVPLARGDQKIGFLLLGAPPQQVSWPEEDREVIKRLGDHIARSFLNREKITRLEFAENGLGIVDDLEVTAKIDSLEDENRLLTGRLSELQEKFIVVDRELKIARKVAEERRGQPKKGEAEELKQEVSVLRDALIEAEISLGDSQSQHDKSESAMPTLEKYSQTITQYSGELELSQQRIEQLEFQLNRIRSGTQDVAFSSPGEEIRSPLAMIQSYTDLLLVDTTGFLTVKQIDLLQRIKYSTSRVSTLLGRLDSLWQDRVKSLASSDLDSVFTQTLTTLGETLESRNIKLNLEMDDQFPPIPMGATTLNHVFASILSHMMHLMPDGGLLNVALRIDEIDEGVYGGAEESKPSDSIKFLLFSAATENVIWPDEHKSNGNEPSSISSAVDGVYAIVKAHAGRIWTDVNPSRSNYQTTILLPVFGDEALGSATLEALAATDETELVSHGE
ncbi:MAG: hypothetical protein AB8G95_29795 [Anaerolineae bacterium]